MQRSRSQSKAFINNSMIPPKDVGDACQLTTEAAELLKKVMSEYFISARSYNKILKIARTIADLEEKPIIGVDEVSEAVSYRCLDSRVWLL
jgi:magnesium chelatase family protein